MKDYSVFNAVLRATDEYLPRVEDNGATTDQCRYVEDEYRDMLTQYRLRLAYEQGRAYYIPSIDMFVPSYFRYECVDGHAYETQEKERK